MKKILKNLIACLAISCMVISCSEDPCEEVNCGEFGTCVEGVCDCNDGYEIGTDGTCTESRAKYFGTYNATESCVGSGGSSGTFSWSMTIEALSTGTINQISLSNFGNYDEVVIGTLDGSGVTFTQTTGLVTIEGSGTFNGDTLEYTYTASIGSASETCTGSAIKQ